MLTPEGAVSLVKFVMIILFAQLLGALAHWLFGWDDVSEIVMGAFLLTYIVNTEKANAQIARIKEAWERYAPK